MRFERQIAIEQIGELGQRKIRDSKVLIIGAGGLGSPVISYLSSGGIGNIIIVDKDTVSMSNLNRQFIYGVKDIGKAKADIAKKYVEERYPDINLRTIKTEITAKTIEEIGCEVDIIVDCVDNIKTRLIVNDYSISKNIPLVEGGIKGFYGFATTVKNRSSCMRCLGYADVKEETNIPVIGTTAGVIGSIMANEVIKIALGIDKLLTNKILQYDGLENDFEIIEIHNQKCKCNES